MVDERSAGMVLYRDDAGKKMFLLLHYPSGHWDFVKGRIEKDEQPKEAALREAREETGITDIQFVDGYEERIQYSYQYDGRAVRKEVIFFLAKTCTSSITLSDEHLNFTWLEFDDALKKITYQNARSLLAKSKKLVFA
ncbi:bis(5'-nucleosyl)-tetraphosphatase [Candidatus Nitrosotenuis cloacae]|jgi:bis(5'-nucleosidyl)-tetraphosphatase|uniref:bis(5'-nucleosyl)-tetraphosphatase n=1 Tax=Candidatus Nitrosotenuis cloacae TaxID=1603555 RepID=UPI0022819BF6|nr:NUDIX domain-containing protein [Candidatus Nitrosotenuis cloacae]